MKPIFSFIFITSFWLAYSSEHSKIDIEKLVNNIISTQTQSFQRVFSGTGEKTPNIIALEFQVYSELLKSNNLKLKTLMALELLEKYRTNNKKYNLSGGNIIISGNQYMLMKSPYEFNYQNKIISITKAHNILRKQLNL